MTDSENKMRIALVGHTNAGKTSLLRTLARDETLGEVSPSPATTREVTSITLLADGREVADFRDTPGLEDSIGLLDFVDRLRTDRREDGPSLIERFLGTTEAGDQFAQEAKALRQARVADIVLYVIDARDRVLARHQDELELITRCGRPVLPVLNFVADDAARTDQWRDALARLGLHAAASFDTVIFNEQDETRLFEAIRVLAEEYRTAIDALIADRAVRRERTRERAARALAELLVDVASYVQVVKPPSKKNDVEQRLVVLEAEHAMQAAIRAHERRAHHAILAAFEFGQTDPDGALLECTDGRLGMDVFSRESLKQTGVGGAAGAAGGAATGAALDVALGGLSLGAAAAIGAIAGAVLGSSAAQSKRMIRKARGADELRAGEQTLRVLLSRGLDLTQSLLHRGHADTSQLSLNTAPAAETEPNDLMQATLKILTQAKAHPTWSGLKKTAQESRPRRTQIKRLSALLQKSV